MSNPKSSKRGVFIGSKTKKTMKTTPAGSAQAPSRKKASVLGSKRVSFSPDTKNASFAAEGRKPARKKSKTDPNVRRELAKLLDTEATQSRGGLEEDLCDEEQDLADLPDFINDDDISEKMSHLPDDTVQENGEKHADKTLSVDMKSAYAVPSSPCIDDYIVHIDSDLEEAGAPDAEPAGDELPREFELSTATADPSQREIEAIAPEGRGQDKSDYDDTEHEDSDHENKSQKNCAEEDRAPHKVPLESESDEDIELFSLLTEEGSPLQSREGRGSSSSGEEGDASDVLSPCRSTASSGEDYCPMEQEPALSPQPKTLLGEVLGAQERVSRMRATDEPEEVSVYMPRPRRVSRAPTRKGDAGGEAGGDARQRASVRKEKRLRLLAKRNRHAEDEERENEWLATLSETPKSFFTSDEALVKKSRFTKDELLRGRHLYPGVSVFPVNNYDLGYIFRLAYAARERTTHPTSGPFAQLRSTYGQICRFLIAVRAVPAEMLHKKGAVFSAIDGETMQAFLTFFKLHAAKSTAAQKACHVRMITDYSLTFFRANGLADKAGKMEETQAIVRSICAHSRAESKLHSMHRSYQSRLEEKRIVTAEDMKRINKSAMAGLHSVMGTIAKMEREDGESAVTTYLCRRGKLISKYSIDLTIALIMNGGGQRPQVYASLLVPTKAEQRSWTKVVRLRVDREKTPRVRPYLALPLSMRTCVDTYLKYFRPIVADKSHSPESRDAKYLFLHTRTGDGVSVESLRATFKNYLSYLDADLEGVSPMTIRTSHATNALEKYRASKVGKGRTEEQFLGDLASSMNTSVEMLHKTYVALRDEDYDDAVRYLSESLELVSDDSDS